MSKTGQIYIYRFGNNKNELGRKRLRWKGRRCRVLVSGGMNSCLVEFIDNGEQINCSWNALRKGGADGISLTNTVTVKGGPLKQQKKLNSRDSNHRLPRLVPKGPDDPGGPPLLKGQSNEQAES